MSVDYDTCDRCYQPITARRSHVYAVRITTSDDRKIWIYSDPVTEKEADSQVAEIKAGGGKAQKFEAWQAVDERLASVRKRVKKAKRRK